MSQKKEEIIEGIFKPNKETGISEWITREFIQTNYPRLMGNNGNFRRGICFGVHKYKWEMSRLNNKSTNKVLKIRTIGYYKNEVYKRPINKEFRIKLFKLYKSCIHCGNHKELCIDHKNDMYNDKRVLNEKTQTISDFQVLCNKCNKDLKHQANVKEKKEGKIHSVKDFNLSAFSFDNFEYPWERGIRIYDETDISCKMYSYWYDIEEFHRKRDIFVMITRSINRYILKKVKLIS
tara:strand:+ start:128 stop:832 length:705 start_codon:yes stop_codon:yes gene_type:complete